MGDYLQYKMIQFLAFFLRVLPISFSLWCGRRAGDFIFFCLPRRRKIALDNVTKAYGNTLSETEKRRIARVAFQSMAVSVVELFIVKRIKNNLDGHFTLLGNEYLEQAFSQGKGVMLVISHLGSWEYLSFLPFITGRSWTVVVKNIKNPYLNEYVKRLRLATTVKPIEKVNSMRPIFKELKKNHGVAILIDQWAGAEGLWLDFFDVKTSTTSIPARLAKKTGCPLIPAYCLRKAAGKYEIHIHPPVLLDQDDENWERKTTEKLNRLLEEQIRKNPGQWLWAHRRWKKQAAQIRSAEAVPAPPNLKQ